MRETASFRLPVSQATLPEGLAALAQTATSDDRTTTEQPQPDATLSAPQCTETPDHVADERPETEETPAFEPPLVLRRMAE
jgi:hypothetical protein